MHTQCGQLIGVCCAPLTFSMTARCPLSTNGDNVKPSGNPRNICPVEAIRRSMNSITLMT